METRIRLAFLAIIVAGGLFAPSVLAGQGPQVYSVSEGRNIGSSAPTLTIYGKGLTQFERFDLYRGSDSTYLAPPTFVARKGSMLVLGLDQAVTPGAYSLFGYTKKGNMISIALSIGNGKPLPGSVGAGALDAALLADLADADTLAGQGPGYYRNADNLNGGTVSTALYSAYGDLAAEGKVGTGAGQVAHGDHDHDAHNDGRYSPLDHDHAYSPLGHDHDDRYPLLNHDHDDIYSKRALLGVKVYLSSDQVIVPDLLTKIAFDTESFDTDECHDINSNPERLTCRTPGFYLVGARLSLSLDALNPDIRLLKNGTTAGVLAVDQNAWFYGPFETTTLVSLAEGDYLEFSILHENGQGNRSAKSGEGFTEFWMYRVGD